MDAIWTFVIVTVVWGCIGAVVPFLIPKGINRGLLQLLISLTAACCYLFWILNFLMQLNPLIGPELENTTYIWLQHEWR